jgi:glyoxylate reductase
MTCSDMEAAMKPKVYVTRHFPENAMKVLIRECVVEIWDEEFPPPDETILEAVADIKGLLCLLTDRIDAALMDAAPLLKVISQCAVGYDNIDVQAATERGIAVGNTPGVLTDATADFTFTLLMAAARRVGEAIDYVRAGKWNTWGLTTLLGQEIYQATLGLVGFGRIGQAVARRARGFEMRILYHDTTRQLDAERVLGAEYCDLDWLLAESDFVSTHVNLTPQTQGLIGARQFEIMKPTATLVNTSRGSVVDSEALYEALKSGQIANAALDVTDPEPLPLDHKLLTLPNLLIVPHIASATVNSRTQMAMMAVKNLIAGVHGDSLPYPVN